MTKQELELTWIGKDKRPKLEPRILFEDPSAFVSRQAARNGQRFVRQPAERWPNLTLDGDAQ